MLATSNTQSSASLIRTLQRRFSNAYKMVHVFPRSRLRSLSLHTQDINAWLRHYLVLVRLDDILPTYTVSILCQDKRDHRLQDQLCASRYIVRRRRSLPPFTSSRRGWLVKSPSRRCSRTEPMSITSRHRPCVGCAAQSPMQCAHATLTVVYVNV
jgi:hypothetical protein